MLWEFLTNFTHHKLFLVELSVFVTGHRDGDSLLVGVVVAGLGRHVISWIQTVGLLRRYRQHSQDQLPLSGPDQVHHLLVRCSFYIHSVPEEIVGGKRQIGCIVMY